jgi:hypothetical protein
MTDKKPESHDQTPSPESAPESKDEKEIHLPNAEHELVLDGLRAWQAAIVRLWSASTDSFAELTLTWLPPEAEGAPWTARLSCGDRAEPGWAEDVQVTAAASIQQSLQRLWDRAQVRHGLFKDDPSLMVKLPTDFPADLWLTVGERALLDRLINTLKRGQSSHSIRLIYRPDQRLSARWLASLYDPAAEPGKNVIHEVYAASLLYVTDALLAAMIHKPADAPNLELPQTRALSERPTDRSIQTVPEKDVPPVKKPDEA